MIISLRSTVASRTFGEWRVGLFRANESIYRRSSFSFAFVILIELMKERSLKDVSAWWPWLIVALLSFPRSSVGVLCHFCCSCGYIAVEKTKTQAYLPATDAITIRNVDAPGRGAGIAHRPRWRLRKVQIGLSRVDNLFRGHLRSRIGHSIQLKRKSHPSHAGGVAREELILVGNALSVRLLLRCCNRGSVRKQTSTSFIVETIYRTWLCFW